MVGNLKQILFSRTTQPLKFKPSMQQKGLVPAGICSNDDPVFIRTYVFYAKVMFCPHALVQGKLLKSHSMNSLLQRPEWQKVCVFIKILTQGFSVRVLEINLKVKFMQRSGTEAIRTIIQPSKLKREITYITNSQNTKRKHMVNQVSSYFPKGGYSATATELK